MAIVIRRFEERDEVEHFDCGDERQGYVLDMKWWARQDSNL